MNAPTPFDAIAHDYDRTFTESGTGRLQRVRVHRFLEQLDLLQRPARVLELNCGTGEDALWLAGQGHRVTATDSSEAMLTVAKEKIRKAGALQGSVAFLRYDMDEAVDRNWIGSFDLIFSNFGGMNCLDGPALQRLASGMADCLRPGGLLVTVVMGRRCLTERLYFLAKGSPEKAFRRMRVTPQPAKLTDKIEQPVWYYRPSELDRLFSGRFQRRHLRPIGFFLPPSYLDRRFAGHPRLLRLLYRLERSTGELGLLADHADHYLASYSPQLRGPVTSSP
jgi:SAM-dependent methyltransferase